MSEGSQQAALRLAEFELQRYLSDDIPPLMAAEIFEVLLPYPPEVTARVVAQWIEWQLTGPSGSTPVSDLVFHALRKIHLLGEFDLVPRAPLAGYLNGVAKILVSACPAGERDAIRLRLSRLGETETVLQTRAELLHHEAEAEGTPERSARRATGADAPADPKRADPAAVGRGARALSVLLERLGRARPAVAGAPPTAQSLDGALLSRILATAAIASKTDDDLSRHLDEIGRRGFAQATGQVFRELGRSLPGWTSVGPNGEVIAGAAGRPLEAMNRIVSLASNPQERAKRWGEMIYAAVEQFNEGRLAQTVSILEAAKGLIAANKPDPEIVASILEQAGSAISEGVLRRLADAPERHGLVRKVLDFFPALGAEALLTRLDGEMRRERRKLFLALLEVHGPTCRDLVLSRLAKVMAGEIPDAEGFYRRNLVFLLRRIPRSSREGLPEELAMLEAMIAHDQPAISAKEAAGALGQVRDPHAERALVERFRRLEGEIERGRAGAESWELLDRLCAAVARIGTPPAIRTIATHAFKRSRQLGDTAARFEHLAWIDLTADPEQLSLLLTAMRDLIPSRMLGLVIGRSQHDLAYLIQAVSGTPDPAVRSVLHDIEVRFKGHALGEAAAKALLKLEPRARETAPADAMTGDLEIFGLPNLLQSFTNSRASGELVLFDQRQSRIGSIGLFDGGVTRAETDRLTGAEAVYLLLEKPFPGTFAFRAIAATGQPAPRTALDPMALILEGVRRHDEYQQARAIAPDGLRLEPAGIPAIRPEDEEDGEFAGDVWDRSAAGTPPEHCEAEMRTDPFRVRHLYAFWIETAALKPRVELATA
jgi:Domain of unknown function (DUF4388)